MKKLVAIMAGVALLAGVAQAEILLEWDFSGDNAAQANLVANSVTAGNLATGGAYNDLTRGDNVPSSAGANSFRTTGFQNAGIAANFADDRWFQVVMSSAPGWSLSLSGIEATFAGTASYAADPGVDMQWAYSLNGVDFNLIDVPVNRTGVGSSSFDLSNTAALQDVGSGTDVTLRFTSSGQTTTGGWGYIGDGGLQINGEVIPEPGTMALLALGLGGLVAFARRRR